MGNEATCECEWNGSRHNVNALLEPPHLILRGEIRRRLPLDETRSRSTVNGDQLSFSFKVNVSPLRSAALWLRSGPRGSPLHPPASSKSWASPRTPWYAWIGPSNDPAVQEALSAARAVTDLHPDLILARINTLAELKLALRTAAAQLAARVPIWFIYPKGRVTLSPKMMFVPNLWRPASSTPRSAPSPPLSPRCASSVAVTTAC